MIKDFIANIYELWGAAYFEGFSADMYDINAYAPIFIWMIVSIVFVNITYYYIVNNPRLSRWWHWMIFNLVISLLNFAIGWGISYGKLFDLYNAQNMDLPYFAMTEFFPFASICFCWTFVLFFILTPDVAS